MKETRFFFVPCASEQQELPEEEAVHALRVLRLKNGDEMFLMDGQGCFYRAEVTVATNKRCLYTIKDVMPQEKMWRGWIHLAVAPTKMMERMEWFAEKATEMGVDEISFLQCRFSERKQMKTMRLDKIVTAAVKQSRKAWHPIVNPMMAFEEFVKQPRQGHKYIAHCYSEIERGDFFQIIQAPEIKTGEDEITVLIGPEGDFSMEEVQLAMELGYESVTLGEARLRTETAALSAVMMSQLTRRKVKASHPVFPEGE